MSTHAMKKCKEAWATKEKNRKKDRLFSPKIELYCSMNIVFLNIFLNHPICAEL